MLLEFDIFFFFCFIFVLSRRLVDTFGKLRVIDALHEECVALAVVL